MCSLYKCKLNCIQLQNSAAKLLRVDFNLKWLPLLLLMLLCIVVLIYSLQSVFVEKLPSIAIDWLTFAYFILPFHCHYPYSHPFFGSIGTHTHGNQTRPHSVFLWENGTSEGTSHWRQHRNTHIHINLLDSLFISFSILGKFLPSRPLLSSAFGQWPRQMGILSCGTSIVVVRLPANHCTRWM